MTMRTTVPSPQPEHEPAAADEAVGVLAEHHVGQGLLVAILDRGRRAGSCRRRCRGGSDRACTRRSASAVALLGHHQGVVALGHANVHALGAALAVVRVDEEAEVGALDALLGGHVAVLGGVDEVLPGRLGGQRRVRLGGGERVDRLRQRGLRLGGGHDGAVRAGADAGHAAHALLGHELRDQRREAAEVAVAGRGRGDQAAPDALVGGQLDVRDAASVGVDDRRVEVLDVRGDVEGLRRDESRARGRLASDNLRAGLFRSSRWQLFRSSLAQSSGLSQPGPYEVAGRDDADRGGRLVGDDEAVDSALVPSRRRPRRGPPSRDGQRRLCHDLPDGQAAPVRS